MKNSHQGSLFDFWQPILLLIFGTVLLCCLCLAPTFLKSIQSTTETIQVETTGLLSEVPSFKYSVTNVPTDKNLSGYASETYTPSRTSTVSTTPSSFPTATLTSLPPTSTSTQTQTSTQSPIGKLRVAVLDVGQGLSVLIITPDGEVALFDGGPGGAASAVLQDLAFYHVTRLDTLFVSHPHEDHIGGIPAILQNIPVSRIVSSGQSYTTVAYEKFLNAALASNASWVEAGRGDSFSIGGILFQVYSPPSPRPEGDLNHNSLVIHFVFGQIGFLLMGDADKEAESTILAMGLDIKADALQVGHHCSRSSSGLSFLMQVQPKYAVCSVGAGNPYGHPHSETLDALTKVGATVYRTDLNGTVLFSSDGFSISVEVDK